MIAENMLQDKLFMVQYLIPLCQTGLFTTEALVTFSNVSERGIPLESEGQIYAPPVIIQCLFHAAKYNFF